MIDLHTLQNHFASGLSSDNDQILAYIKQNKKLSAKEHLTIYQSSIFGALQKTLKDIYAVCHKLVGEDFFIHMINTYIQGHASRSPDIASYGESFSEFIYSYEPARSLPYLAHVAYFEWAWHKAFSGPETKRMDFVKLAACYQRSPEKIIFCLPANSFLLASPYPIHRIWEMNQEDDRGEQTIVLEENTNYYFFIWRKEFEMRADLLSEAEWKMLNFIQARHNIGDIFELVKNTLPGTSFDAILPDMITRGWLVDCEME